VLWIVGLALVIRLVAVAILPANHAQADDSYYYLVRGEHLAANTLTPQEVITFAPLYAFLAGSATHVLGLDNAILALRVLGAILGALTCGFVWRIAQRLTGDNRIAIVAMLGLALNPIAILDNNMVTTETLFLFLLTWAFSIYVVPQPDRPAYPRTYIASGALFGLATLTRVQPVLFPVGLAIHLSLVFSWRKALRAAAVLLVVYAAVVSTWTVYNLIKFNTLIIGASGATDFLLTGALGYNGSTNVDKQFADHNDGIVPQGDGSRAPVAAKVVEETIRNNPIGYLSHRVKELLSAILQPHMTTYFPGASLKSMAANWLLRDRSPGGLARLLGDSTFWPKLAMYVAHYLALIFGAAGVLLTWREWRKFAPLTGFIAYILLLHLFLLVIPRYVYPITPLLWVFAAVAMVRLWERVRNTRALAPVKIYNPVERDTDSVVS